MRTEFFKGLATIRINPDSRIFHRFNVAFGKHTLLDEFGDVVVAGSQVVVDTVITKKLPRDCTIFYYQRADDGITFEKFAKWSGR
jgi:hypothetical protein